MRTIPIYLDGDIPFTANVVWVKFKNVNGYMAAGTIGNFTDKIRKYKKITIPKVNSNN